MSFVQNISEPGSNQRIALIALGGVGLCAILVAVYLVFFHASYAVLFADLRSLDAATIVSDLDKKKVPYRLKDGGATILVPSKIADATRLAVMSEDLPLKGQVGFELFNKSDMGLTEFAQKINYRRALQGELSRTLMALDVIDSARVQLSLSDPTVFREDHRPSKASVTVIPRVGQSITPETVRGIQKLVAAAALDLEASDVVVLDEHGALIGGDNFAPLPVGPPALRQKEAIEEYYSARIRLALQRFYPEDGLQVQVKAIDPGVSATAAPPQGTLPVSDPFGSWSPTTRDFSLQVRVIVSAPMGPEILDQVQIAAAQAMNMSAGVGDVLSVGSGMLDNPNQKPSLPLSAGPSQVPNNRTTFGLSEPTQFWLGITAPLMLALVALVFWLQRQHQSPRALSESQQDDYAMRIKSLLDQEVGNDTSGF